MFDIFGFISDNEKFTYLNSIKYEGKNYVAYMDEENIYISEYKLENNEIVLDDISDELYDILLGKMDL